jgi:hypothetical protein
MVINSFELTSREAGSVLIEESISRLPEEVNPLELQYLILGADKSIPCLTCNRCSQEHSAVVDILFSIEDYILDVELRVRACQVCRHIDYAEPFSLYITEAPDR